MTMLRMATAASSSLTSRYCGRVGRPLACWNGNWKSVIQDRVIMAGSTVAAQSQRSTSSSSSSSFFFSTSTTIQDSDRPFSKVLIANRGEIACRVIRTCRQMGIPTVALYSVADGPHCLHASMADEKYQIGNGPHPTESYLLHDDVLEIAQRSGAQAIHPGYGVSIVYHSFGFAASKLEKVCTRRSIFKPV